jgi:hypothetical protein
MSFGERLTKARKDYEASVHEEANIHRQEEGKREKERARKEAILENFTQRFIDPVLDQVNESVASGKGEISRHPGSASLVWNKGSDSLGGLSGEKINMTVDENGILVISAGYFDEADPDKMPVSINSLEYEDVKSEIEDEIIDILAKGRQKYSLPPLQG